jgi:hypothetical protein
MCTENAGHWIAIGFMEVDFWEVCGPVGTT